MNYWWQIQDILSKYGLLKRAKTKWGKKLRKKEREEALDWLAKKVTEKYDKVILPMEYTHFGWNWLELATYGVRKVYHPGVDLNKGSAWSDNKLPLRAIADGVVTWKGYSTGWGWHMYILHQINHKKYGEIKVWSHFAHLYQNPPVKVGQRVKCGDIVARVGNTGASTAPHLHWELRKQPLGVNYFPYSKSRVWILNRYYSPIDFVKNG